MGIWFLLTFISIGLLITGLLLFPFSLKFNFLWDPKSISYVEVKFFGRFLYKYQPELNLSSQIYSVSEISHTKIATRDDLFYPSPENVTQKSTHATLEKKDSEEKIPFADGDTQAPIMKTWIKIVCNHELWIATLKYILKLIKPSFGLINFRIDQLEIQLSQRDPIILAQIQAFWVALKPILAPEQNVRLIIDWDLKSYLKLEGELHLRHYLCFWLPWIFTLIICFPWVSLWDAWRKSKLPNYEQNLNTLEKALCKFLSA